MERRTEPNDGRGILVVMTPEGRERVDAAIRTLLAAKCRAARRLSAPGGRLLGSAAWETESQLRADPEPVVDAQADVHEEEREPEVHGRLRVDGAAVGIESQSGAS